MWLACSVHVKPLVVTAAVLLVACTDPADKAAKQRIFSPEDPPQAVAAAGQKLPPQDADDRPEIARRILGMGAAEATERLGAHHYTATVDWEWTQTGKNLRLKEMRDLVAGAGGMSGDFHAQLSNTDNAGLEVLRVAGQVYARTTWGREGEGRFRQRLRDRGMAERIREETWGALRDLDELFRGRLKLTAQSSNGNTTSFAGRTAWKYAVSLAEAGSESPSRLPPIASAKGGADETTRRRQHFYDARMPSTLQGEVLVDAQTSVVLKTHIIGRVSVKGGGDPRAPDADLRVTLDSFLSDIGKPVAFAPPKDFLPDEDKPDGVAAALARVGMERKADGGVTTGPELPDDLDEDQPVPSTAPPLTVVPPLPAVPPTVAPATPAPREPAPSPSSPRSPKTPKDPAKGAKRTKG